MGNKACRHLRVQVESAEGLADALQGLEALQAGGDGHHGLARAGLALLLLEVRQSAA